MNRITTSTEGKKVSFSYTGEYYLPENDKKEFFKDRLLKSAFIVAYTTVVRNKGHIISTRFGIPCYEEYNNGYIGHQSFQGFDTLAEAKRDYELRKELSTKMGIYAYCDVFLIDMSE